MTTIRGCCFGAGHLLSSLGIETDGGHAIEATYQTHRREVEHKGEVDWVKLAAIHLFLVDAEPTLFDQTDGVVG